MSLESRIPSFGDKLRGEKKRISDSGISKKNHKSTERRLGGDNDQGDWIGSRLVARAQAVSVAVGF